MAHQFYCDRGEFVGGDEAVQMVAHDPEMRAALYPGCGPVGEPVVTFEEAESIGQEHNSDNPGHGGSVRVDTQVDYTYVCQVGDTLSPDADGLRHHLEESRDEQAGAILAALFPGCGLTGPVTATFDEAQAAGLAHIAERPEHGGYVAEVPDDTVTAMTPGEGVASLDDIDVSAADELNTANLKSTPDDGSVSYVQAGRILLIGEGHPWPAVRAVGAAPDYATGYITVEKGGRLSSGRLAVSGCTDQAEFKRAVARISSKTVLFVRT